MIFEVFRNLVCVIMKPVIMEKKSQNIVWANIIGNIFLFFRENTNSNQPNQIQMGSKQQLNMNKHFREPGQRIWITTCYYIEEPGTQKGGPWVKQPRAGASAKGLRNKWLYCDVPRWRREDCKNAAIWSSSFLACMGFSSFEIMNMGSYMGALGLQGTTISVISVTTLDLTSNLSIKIHRILGFYFKAIYSTTHVQWPILYICQRYRKMPICVFIFTRYYNSNTNSNLGIEIVTNVTLE